MKSFQLVCAEFSLPSEMVRAFQKLFQSHHCSYTCEGSILRPGNPLFAVAAYPAILGDKGCHGGSTQQEAAHAFPHASIS